MILLRVALVGIFLSFLGLQGQTASTPIVRFHTNLGDIYVRLLPNSAPKTVANFLTYVNAGAYNNSIIHRSVPGFVVQGGGYQLMNGTPVAIPAKAPIGNEANATNAMGTIAMALSLTDLNSATTQWFFNEVDNNANGVANGTSNTNLDASSFTVFGRIDPSDAASLATLQNIAGVQVFSSTPLASMFNQLPLIDYTSGPVMSSNFVVVESITEVQESPSILTNGVITASAFGGYPAAAPGSFIEIYGSNLAGTTRGWSSADFSGLNAPTSLSGVRVTVDGQPAYVSFVSPTQVNVQVPAGVSSAIHQASVVLTYNGQTSASAGLAVRPYEGALLAPPNFNVGGTQYIAAVHSNGSFVSNGKIPGVPAAPATPGETLVFYGLGFGPVTGTPVAGEIAQGQTTLANPLQIMIGQSQAQTKYAGFAPGYVGLYQFNVVVPANAPNGDLPISVTLGPPDLPQTLPQTLYLSVQASK